MAISVLQEPSVVKEPSSGNGTSSSGSTKQDAPKQGFFTDVSLEEKAAKAAASSANIFEQHQQQQQQQGQGQQPEVDQAACEIGSERGYGGTLYVLGDEGMGGTFLVWPLI